MLFVSEGFGMKVSFYKYSMFLFFLVSGLKCAELPFSDQEMVNLDDLFDFVTKNNHNSGQGYKM